MTSHWAPPPPALARDALCYFWETDGAPAFREEVILPKGIVEIIFNFSPSPAISVRQGPTADAVPRCFITGFYTQPIYLNLPIWQRFFGVCLHPTAARRLVGAPAGEFANQSVDLTLLDAEFDSLWHQLLEAGTFQQRVACFTAWVERRWAGADLRDQLFNRLLNPGLQPVPTVPELARTLGYSPRHLARKVAGLTGMNTEELCQYQKYRQSVTLICTTALSLTEIAYACQFADQSHFIKTFRHYAQLTPGAYRQQKGPVEGHILRNVR